MMIFRPFGSAAFRRSDRERRTDARRLGSLSGAVAAALSGVTAEISGLASRNELLRGWAGDLLGTADCSGIEREHEAELLDAEQQLLAGSRRLARLEESRRVLVTMRQALEAHLGPAAAVRPGPQTSTVGDLSAGR